MSVSYFLLKNDLSVGQKFLDWLCCEEGNRWFNGSRRPSVTPWKGTEQDIRTKFPDIRIEIPDSVLVLVEVKHLSPPPDEGQVKSYLTILREAVEKGLKAKLVILTKETADAKLENVIEKALREVDPDAIKLNKSHVKTVIWPNVAKELHPSASSDPVAKFLIDQFFDFLQMLDLTDQPSDPDTELEKAISEALKMAKFPVSDKGGFPPGKKWGAGHSWEYRVGEKRGYVFYYYGQPQFIRLNVDPKKLDDQARKKLKKSGAEKYDGWPCFTLDLEAEGYDGLTPEDRMSLLTRRLGWIRDTLEGL